MHCLGGERRSPRCPYADLAEVRGQSQAKRVLEIAAAGGHSLLLAGPPGSGKSMLATRLPGLLPPMSEKRCARVGGSAVAGRAVPLACASPYRSPHHSASSAALVGGGWASSS